jgi:hypothetical protein
MFGNGKDQNPFQQNPYEPPRWDEEPPSSPTPPPENKFVKQLLSLLGSALMLVATIIAFFITLRLIRR